MTWRALEWCAACLAVLFLGCFVGASADDCPPVDPPANPGTAYFEIVTGVQTCTPVPVGFPKVGRQCYLGKGEPPEDTSQWACYCKTKKSKTAWCQPTNDGCHDDVPSHLCKRGYAGEID